MVASERLEIFTAEDITELLVFMHDLLKRGCRFRIMVEKNSETVFPQLRDQNED